MENYFDSNVKTKTPSMYNNVKQGINRLNIYHLNGWKDRINVNNYDDSVISYFHFVPSKNA